MQGCDKEACECRNGGNILQGGGGCTMMTCATCSMMMHARLDINECEKLQRESLSFDPALELSETAHIGVMSASELSALNNSINKAKKALAAYMKEMKRLYASKKYRRRARG